MERATHVPQIFYQIHNQKNSYWFYSETRLDEEGMASNRKIACYGELKIKTVLIARQGNLDVL